RRGQVERATARGDQYILDGRVGEVATIRDLGGPASLADRAVVLRRLDLPGHVAAREADGDEHHPERDGTPRALGAPPSHPDSERSLSHVGSPPTTHPCSGDAKQPRGPGHPGSSPPGPGLRTPDAASGSP